MKTTTKILLYLVVVALVDTLIPIPLAALMLIYVLYEKPVWFRNYFEAVYGS